MVEANIVIDSLLTPALKELMTMFKRHEFELRVVGGAVRDLLDGRRQPNDIDLATTATPDEMLAMFAKESDVVRAINVRAARYGTITCRVYNEQNFEVTTLRVDEHERRATAAVKVEFSRDWRLDAERRDLTINSMFLTFDGTVVDYFNGRDDLAHRRVRFVGDPARRIRQDYSRILRYFRFVARFSAIADDETLRAIRENAAGLATVSGERVWQELKKITAERYANNVFQLMRLVGVASFVGLPANTRVADEERRVGAICGISLLPISVVASLLNDASDLSALHARVKLSKRELRTGKFIIRHRFDDELASNAIRWARRFVCDTTAHRRFDVVQLLKYRALTDDEIERFNELPTFPITGYDLIPYDIVDGSSVGDCLRRLREAWIRSDCRATKEQLLTTM